MPQQSRASLLELGQPLPPRLLAIVLPLRQPLPRHIVPALHPRPVERRVVHPPAGLVHPAAGDAVDDDARRRDQVRDQVDGDELVQGRGLRRGAREAVEDK